MEKLGLPSPDWSQYWLQFKEGSTPATTYMHPALIQAINGKRVLDMGCGFGRNSVVMAKAATEVVGVDINESEINYAAQHNNASNITYEVMNGVACRFPDDAFDVVTLFGVLGGVQEDMRRQILAESSRMLASGGLLYIGEQTVSYASPYAETDYADGLRTTGEPGSTILRKDRDPNGEIVIIAKHFTPQEISDFLEECTFGDVWIDTPLVPKRSFSESGTVFEREVLCAFAVK